MLRIEWDKKSLEEVVHKYPGKHTILDYWIPLFVYVDTLEISGLKEIPEGDVTHISTFFPELLSIIQLFDPEKLKTAYPFNELGIQKNRVTGGGFELLFKFDEDLDSLTMYYSNKGIPESRSIKIPLKEYVEGVLHASKEILKDINIIAPEKYMDDSGVTSLQTSYYTVRRWYEERYHEPVEDKYQIPRISL